MSSRAWIQTRCGDPDEPDRCTSVLMNLALPHLLILLGTAAGIGAPAPHGSQRSCETGVISAIFIDNHSIFDTTDPALESRLARAYRFANGLHVRTRESVIRRELLFRRGDCYDPAVLEESERLLRAHDFLSRVDIFGIRQPDGTYHVIVDTQDEWSTRVDLRVTLRDGLAFEGFRVREANLLGTGRAVELYYLERDANHEYGIAYATPQLAGTRWDLDLSVGRTRAGSSLRQSVAYPFVGEAGRWAARQTLRRQDFFYDYVTEPGGGAHLLLPVREEAFEIAVLRRTGPVGRMFTFGAALGYSELSHPGGEAAVEWIDGDDYDSGVPADEAALASIRRQLNSPAAIRLLLLAGRREVTWVKRRGLDSMRGEQDVALGTELEVAAGRALPWRGGGDDLYAAVSGYAAAELGDLLVAGTLRGDARHDFRAAGSDGWKDIFADGELIAYWRPGGAPRHTFVARAAAAHGWRTRTPYQLALGGDLGVRGYDRFRYPGGHRLLFSAEDRIYFGWPFRDVLDVGGTLFLDVGRVWPGDAPFGTDSGWKAAAGIGLRGTLPAGGRTTYRVDLALPLEHGTGWKDLRLILSIGELIGIGDRIGAHRPQRARPIGRAGEAFHFPR